MFAGQEHERGLVEFIVKAKRKRYEEQLSKVRLRAKFLNKLSHFDDWDQRWTVLIESGKQDVGSISTRLKHLGAPRECWLISSAQYLDGRPMELYAALSDVVGLEGGTVISCLPGVLAYFEGEGPSDRLILLKVK